MSDDMDKSSTMTTEFSTHKSLVALLMAMVEEESRSLSRLDPRENSRRADSPHLEEFCCKGQEKTGAAARRTVPRRL